MISSTQRKIRSSFWHGTGNPNCFATLEVDLTNLDEFLEQHNKDKQNLKITYTIVGLKAMAEALKQTNTCGRIVFGNYIQTDNITLGIIINVEDKDVQYIQVHNAGKASLIQISKSIKGRIRKIKEKKDKQVNSSLKLMKALPNFFLKTLIDITSFVSYCLSEVLPFLNIKKEMYGFGGVTNIQSFGMYDSFGCPVNFARSVVTCVISTSELRPKIIDNEIKLRNCLNYNITFDYRFIDQKQIQEILKIANEVWTNPKTYL